MLSVRTKQTLRLGSGIIMFTFAGLHFINHALGLISFELMDVVQQVRTSITRSDLGRVILLSAFLTHIMLNVPKIVSKRSWRMPAWELTQIITGLLIPILLIPHIVGMNIPEVLWSRDVGYEIALFQLWPAGAFEKLILMTVLWLHGCIGMYYWLRAKRGFKRWRNSLLLLAILIPIFGFLGFVTAARIETLTTVATPLSDTQRAFIAEWKSIARLAAIAGTILVMFAIGVFQYLLTRRRSFFVTFEDGKRLRGVHGQSLLDVSRVNGMKHTSICGGRARCSTCRVAIVDGADSLPPANDAEAALLSRLTLPPKMRLACQTRPTSDIHAVRVIPSGAREPMQLVAPDRLRWGVEAEVTILFADIRGFTTFSQKRMPFDVVFVLNRFMQQMTEVIENHGGYVDKFMGDGIMAIFGQSGDAKASASCAIMSAKKMLTELDALNKQITSLIDEPLRIGIGLHSGQAVVGRVGGLEGQGATGHLTVIGDVVNTASRVESMCKELQAILLATQATIKLADFDVSKAQASDMPVRGRNEGIRVFHLV